MTRRSLCAGDLGLSRLQKKGWTGSGCVPWRRAPPRGSADRAKGRWCAPRAPPRGSADRVRREQKGQVRLQEGALKTAGLCDVCFVAMRRGYIDRMGGSLEAWRLQEGVLPRFGTGCSQHNARSSLPETLRCLSVPSVCCDRNV